MNALDMLDQESFLGVLQREGALQARHGDRYMLVRQIEMFAIRYNECHCEAHSCSGCRQMFEMGSRLRGALPPALDSMRIEIERRRAREIWMEEKRAQGMREAVVQENCRNAKNRRDGAGLTIVPRGGDE